MSQSLETHPSRIQRIALTLLKPKVAIPGLLLVTLFCAPFIYRASRLLGLPDIGPPFDLAKHGTVQIASKDNAYETYVKASALFVPTMSLKEPEERDKALEEGWPAASDGVRKWVTDNRPALELWQEGTAASDALLCQPREQHFDTISEVPQKLREFAQLAKLEGSRLEDEGQPEAAWDMYRAVYRSSRHCGRHGGMDERIIGIAIHGMAAASIEKWAGHPNVDATMLRQALAEISADYEMTSPTSTAFQAAYFTLQNVYDDPALPPMLVEAFGGVSQPVISELPTRHALFLLNEPEVSRRLADHAFANWLAQVDKPRHARTPLQSRAGLLELYDPSPGAVSASPTHARLEEFYRDSRLTLLTFPTITPFDVMVGREQSRQACLVVILAAQTYQRAHGEFPQTLKHLQDGYLDALPADPFGAAGEPIHYRRDGERAIVWSVGENQLDDGGDVQLVSGGGWPPDFGYEFALPGAAEVKPSE